jgi:hypothetical protein
MKFNCQNSVGFVIFLAVLFRRGACFLINDAFLIGTKQCCGSGMFIPDPNFFHPGSRAKKIPGSASASKNYSILTQKILSKFSEI